MRWPWASDAASSPEAVHTKGRFPGPLQAFPSLWLIPLYGGCHPRSERITYATTSPTDGAHLVPPL